MNKKNILTAAVSLSLVACLSIGATLAYFTDSDKATNVLTTGNVKIELIDTTKGPQEGDQWTADDKGDNTGVTYYNVQPGDLLSKDVGVKIDELSSDCYVALQVKVSSNKDVDLEAIRDQIKAQAADEWYVQENYDGTMTFYHRGALQAMTHNSTSQLFNEIKIPEQWGNEYVGASIDIDVKAAAIQSANLEDPSDVENGSATRAELESLLFSM